MHFNFTPLFLTFFSNFKYLPPSLDFTLTPFSKQRSNFYFFNLLKKNKPKYSLIRDFKKFQNVYSYYSIKRTILPTLESTKIHVNWALAMNFFSTILSTFLNFKFIFYFFSRKLNKKLYRFSKQKRPRYSIYFRYLPPFRRFKFLLKFMQKSMVYINGRSFLAKLTRLLFIFTSNTSNFFIFSYLKKLQLFMFKENKRAVLSV